MSIAEVVAHGSFPAAWGRQRPDQHLGINLGMKATAPAAHIAKQKPPSQTRQEPSYRMAREIPPPPQINWDLGLKQWITGRKSPVFAAFSLHEGAVMLLLLLGIARAQQIRGFLPHFKGVKAFISKMMGK